MPRRARQEHPHRVAVVQRPPVLLDRERTMAVALDGLEEAATAGARLVVFPEAFLPGYPEYVWHLRPADDGGLSAKLHARLLANAMDLEAGDLRPLQEAAASRAMTVAVGVQEVDSRFGPTTVYSTTVIVGPDGSLLSRHRKLMPTHPERLVWGQGDGADLEPVVTPLGRVGGLACWENYMPLARYAVYAGGVQLYLAPTWDEGDTWIATLRHIAAEGRCWVIGAGTILQARDVPADLPGRAQLYPDPEVWLNAGDSVIVAPGGEIVAGPLHQEAGLVVADCDPGQADGAHQSLDVTGHYGRPDVFQLIVDRRRRTPFGPTGSKASEPPTD